MNKTATAFSLPGFAKAPTQTSPLLRSKDGTKIVKDAPSVRAWYELRAERKGAYKNETELIGNFFNRSIYTDAEYRENRQKAKMVQEVRYEKNRKTKSGISPIARSIIGDPTALEFYKEIAVRRKISMNLFRNLTRKTVDNKAITKEPFRSKIPSGKLAS